MDKLPIDQIAVPAERLRTDLGDLTGLMESINELGLLHPIIVTSENRLVAGLRRLTACKRLGLTEIRAERKDLDELRIQLIEIDENLVREELREGDRCIHIKRRKDIYLALHPETKRGGDRKSEEAKSKRNHFALIPPSFAADTATKTGESKRSVEQSVQIAESIPLPIMEALESTPVYNSRTDLLRMARLKPEQQKDVTERIRSATSEGKLKTVKDVERELKREEKFSALRAQTELLPPAEKRYVVLYADPAWSYEHMISESRNLDNQYPQLSLQEICELKVGDRPIQELAAEQSMLFLWTTAPQLMNAARVIEAWGFIYRTCMVWDKGDDGQGQMGMGYYARIEHEFLLICRRGDLPTPAPETLPRSIIRAKRGKHSAKPIEAYSIIEKMYPNLPKIELFARNRRDGWDSWGNELPVIEQQQTPTY